MNFTEKAVSFLIRPIYRIFFEKPIWWFLAKVKAYFFAEIGVQLGNFERRFQIEDAVDQQRWTSIEQRLRDFEAANAAQWDALEQLVLALFRQSESRSLDSDARVSGFRICETSNSTELNRVRAAGNLH